MKKKKKISKYDNPFRCTYCHKTKAGGIEMRILSHWPSRHDTLEREIFMELCDDCFEKLVPDEAARLFFTDVFFRVKKDKRKIEVLPFENRRDVK